jgi:hypothetical protein
MLRIPHCLDNRLTDGGKVVRPTHPPNFTPQKHYYFNVSGTHFYESIMWIPLLDLGHVEGFPTFRKTL